MSTEKLTELTDSFASVVGGELLGRLPEAQRQAWVDTVFNPVTEQEAADILDGFGAFLFEEPLEGVEDTIKRKKPKPAEGEVETQSHLECKAEKQRNRLKSKGKCTAEDCQAELLDIFSGNGPVLAKDANEAKCVGALAREEYLTASVYASICETSDSAGKYYLVQAQANKLTELLTK